MRVKQKYQEVNGISKAICQFCNEIVNYPEGIHLRSGIEVHSNCFRIAREKARQNQGNK